MDSVNEKKVEWILRIGFFGTFLGHGILAIMGKKHFVDMFTGMAALVGWSVPVTQATSFILIVGIIDTLAALLILWKPMRILLIGGALWAFATALARPLSNTGDVWLDFVERFANFAVPLALLYMRGLPKTFKEWFD
jgi:hypothetical protein